MSTVHVLNVMQIVLQVAITPPHPGGGGFAIMIF